MIDAWNLGQVGVMEPTLLVLNYRYSRISAGNGRFIASRQTGLGNGNIVVLQQED